MEGCWKRGDRERERKCKGYDYIGRGSRVFGRNGRDKEGEWEEIRGKWRGEAIIPRQSSRR